MHLVANPLAAPSICCSVQSQRQACAPSTSAAAGSACCSRHEISSIVRYERSISGRIPRICRRYRAGIAICEVAVGGQGSSASPAAAASSPGVGSRIRVKGPLKVFHVPKKPEFDLGGHEGEIKEVLTTWKGKTISANLPYKALFLLDIDGKESKVIAHLRDGEFEVIA